MKKNKTGTNKMGDPLLDLHDVAEYLKKSERSVLRLVKDGELRGFKSGGVWRFRQSDVNAYVEQEIEISMKQAKEEEA